MNKQDLSSLRGVQVIAFEEGLRMGKVSEIYIDKQTKAIEGISFKGRLIGKGKESFVTFENTQKLGKDVVIISSETVAKPLPKEVEKSSLQGKGIKVTTVDGMHLGELSDVSVTKDDGKISELILAEDKFLEIEPEDITIGAEAIIVPSDYASRVKENQKEKGVVLTFQVDTETVKETVKETVEKIGESIGEVLKEKAWECQGKRIWNQRSQSQRHSKRIRNQWKMSQEKKETTRSQMIRKKAGTNTQIFASRSCKFRWNLFRSPLQ